MFSLSQTKVVPMRVYTFIGICCNFLRFSILLLHLLKWEEASGLIQTTSFHQLYQVMPTNHAQLHFLNVKRLHAPELIFWNGIGAAGETVLIMGSKEAIAKQTPDFEKNKLNLKVKYDSVKITYVQPGSDGGSSGKPLLDNANAAHSAEDYATGPTPISFHDESEDVEERLARGDKLNDQYESELLIYKRKTRFETGLPEAAGVVPRSQGLLPVKPIKGVTGRQLPINSGIFYRIQGVQTLLLAKQTAPAKGEWTENQQGQVPHVGEYFAVSLNKKRSGTNPYVTSEEDRKKLKNDEYRSKHTKSALWIFVPTEYDKFYEIRSRNYPESLLVWTYDVDEREFVLHMETRKEYLKRYRPDGVLRNRALFSFQLVSDHYEWELRQERPKYYLIAYNSNHVYTYESKKKRCTVLVVRNSATDPYNPPKTDKFNRHLDMFYMTRLNLTGQYTASIYSFMYEKSVVDMFAKSAEDGTIKELASFELGNRGPLKLPQYVVEQVPSSNEYKFQFKNTFKQFQWVTIEAHAPSFGVAPIIKTGVMGKNTNTKEVTRKISKMHKIQDKIMLSSGYGMNASVLFQSIKGFVNPFTALMEVTEPADRLYWDLAGKARFIRLSLPGSFIEKAWNKKAGFKYDRVIEQREAAMIVQIRGTLVASNGLRAFVKKAQMPYSNGIVACDNYN